MTEHLLLTQNFVEAKRNKLGKHIKIRCWKCGDKFTYAEISKGNGFCNTCFNFLKREWEWFLHLEKQRKGEKNKEYSDVRVITRKETV